MNKITGISLNGSIDGMLENCATLTDGTSVTWYYPTDLPFYDDSAVPYTKQELTYYPPFDNHQYPHINSVGNFEIEEMKREIKKLKKKIQNKEIPMENLFNVIVVSTEKKVLLDIKVVASNREEATFNAGVHGVIVEAELKPKDVSILVIDMGQTKVKPETKTVKVVKE